MNIIVTASGQASLLVMNFDLAKTLECGQCFRWSKNRDGSYTGVVQGRVATVSQTKDQLILHSPTLDKIEVEEIENIWVPYFDLQRDYGSMNKKILKQALWMKNAVELGSGIRILKQDPWETAITFVFSANNHIPRITASVDCLAKRYGIYLGMDEKNSPLHAFPTPEALQKLSLTEWMQCGAGYRAAYLMKMVQLWVEYYKELLQVSAQKKELPGCHRDILEKLPGVGPKVSACISLYGLGHHNQFPVDVWIRRRVKELWPEAPETDRDIENSALALFGNAAGYAQQLLFYEARVKKHPTLNK